MTSGMAIDLGSNGWRGDLTVPGGAPKSFKRLEILDRQGRLAPAQADCGDF
jgi:hypothetical protein